MSDNGNPALTLRRTAEYRDSYANSVQVRLSVWDFQLVFGTLEQQDRNAVVIDNFQGIYLSPQQAKALAGVLTQNLAQYEQTFGEIKLQGERDVAEPKFVTPSGPVH
jgi:hypothetical protein